MTRHFRSVILTLCTLLCAETVLASAPPLMNYQGILTNGGGSPQVGTFSVTFKIYDVAAGGAALWTETQNSVTTNSDGRFNVLLGSFTPLADTVFSGSDRFLATAVSPDPEMTPRTRIISVAYAFRAATVDGASGGNITSKVSIGPGHTNSGSNSFVAGNTNEVTGSTSTVAGGVGNRAAGLSSAVLGGGSNQAYGDVSNISGGVSNITTGQYSAIGGGENNRAAATSATVGGGSRNRAYGDYSVIAGGGGAAGGDSNHVGGIGSGILAGAGNVANFQYSTVGGGYGNRAESDYAAILGGQSNQVSAFGIHGVIAGGASNVVSGSESGILSGLGNQTSASYSGVVAGRQNVVSGSAAFVGAGGFNKGRAAFSVVCGGGSGNEFDSNAVSATAGFIGAGTANRVTASHGAIVGGSGNAVSGQSAFVGGGTSNIASATQATVSGGNLNLASGEQSVIAGGEFNEASGRYSTIPGGFSNIASGRFSLAAGRSAQAVHSGSFVWADSTNSSFASTSANQFIVRASNGVGIGTNAPTAGLHINSGGSSGLILALGSSAMDIGWPTGENFQMGHWNGSTFTERMRISTGGQVSIGTTSAGNILTIQQTSSTDPIADAWTTYSSRRWKDSIETLGDALNLVRKLRGVRYVLRADGKHDIGLIAEEVGEVIPEVVAYEENGIDAKSVDYARLVAVLIEGMKEQQERIEVLEERLSKQAP